jgi:hypothetical protein
LDRFAKWSDGTLWDEWDRAGFVDYNLTLPDAELSADDLVRKRSHDAAWQKIKECSAAAASNEPISHRLSYMISSNWNLHRGFLALALLPPFSLLAAGYIFGWIIKGFGAST